MLKLCFLHNFSAKQVYTVNVGMAPATIEGPKTETHGYSF